MATYGKFTDDELASLIKEDDQVMVENPIFHTFAKGATLVF